MEHHLSFTFDRAFVRDVLKRDYFWRAGIGIGVVLGAVASRSMRVLLYGVETDDPAVYVGIVLTLVTTGLLACIIPASRATRTDPVDAMRE